MEISHLIIYGLATWRISSIIVREDGPFHMFLRVRKMAGIIHDIDGNPIQSPDGFFSELLFCVWCSSVWVGLFLTVFWFFTPEWSLIFSVPFAFSGMAILIDKYANK